MHVLTPDPLGFHVASLFCREERLCVFGSSVPASRRGTFVVKHPALGVFSRGVPRNVVARSMMRALHPSLPKKSEPLRVAAWASRNHATDPYRRKGARGALFAYAPRRRTRYLLWRCPSKRNNIQHFSQDTHTRSMISHHDT